MFIRARMAAEAGKRVMIMPPTSSVEDLLTIYLSLVVVLTGNWFFSSLEAFLHRFPPLAHVTLPWAHFIKRSLQNS